MNSFIVFRTLAIFLYFLILPSSVFPQEKPVVFGKVTDAETGEPLILANVYLSNTFMGASTNGHGDYMIRNVDMGVYSLTASYVGYETVVAQVRFDQIGGYKFDFALTAKEYKLEEIIIEGKKPDGWDKNLKLFTQYFLGTSYYSEFCKILNPFVIGFDHDRNNKDFSAVADEMIVIENKALGYILNYSLRDFIVDRKRLYYWGEPYFEEMTPENDDELKKWEENREKVYLGSMRHFLKTLIDSASYKEGYELTLMDAVPPDNLTNAPVEVPGRLFKKINDSEYELDFDGFLQVTYLPGTAYKVKRKAVSDELFPGYNTLTRMERDFAISYLTIKKTPVLFDVLGILYDPINVLPYGVWTNNRIAELLPREYKPTGK